MTQPDKTYAKFYVPRAADLRLARALTMQELAERAGISRDTLRKIEAGHPVTLSAAKRVFAALNELYRGKLRSDKEVTESLPVKRARRSRTTAQGLPGPISANTIANPLFEYRIGGYPPPIEMLIEVGTATPKEIASLFAELSLLYRMCGGSGLTFNPLDAREVERIVA